MATPTRILDENPIFLHGNGEKIVLPLATEFLGFEFHDCPVHGRIRHSATRCGKYIIYFCLRCEAEAKDDDIARAVRDSSAQHFRDRYVHKRGVGRLV